MAPDDFKNLGLDFDDNKQSSSNSASASSSVGQTGDSKASSK